jgi:predicted GNAT superfamily acetyltransferase
MRIKIKDSVITIPDKLIKQLNELDVETANAINTLLAKGERIISQRKQDTARTALMMLEKIK